MGLTLNATAFRAWTQLCAAALSSARAEIDALNVFPVPDGDTGTNAYLTFVSGTDAVDVHPDQAIERRVHGEGLDGVGARHEGQVRVGAGVAVGDREHVEGVDLGPRRRQGGRAQLRPRSECRGVEGEAHGARLSSGTARAGHPTC
jgi:hypothetical protein